jgi:hypothetical protein
MNGCDPTHARHAPPPGRRTTRVATIFRRPGVALLVGVLSGFATAHAESSRPTLANPLAILTLKTLPTTRDRPLFSPERRPPHKAEATIAAAAPPPPPPSPPALSLLGIVSAPRDTHAIVRVAGIDKPRALRRGTTIDGWQVIAIAPQNLTIGRDGRRTTVAMFKPAAQGLRRASPIGNPPPPR